MQSKASTVAEYLAGLPEDRRVAIAAVRKTILANLDKDYAEGMQYGMIGYFVPHSVFPDGYHCDPKQPLPFAGLASQKNHMSVYMMGHYGRPEGERWLKEQFAKAGKKLDMGKCCIRFKKLDDLPLEVIGEAIRRMPAKAYIEFYRQWDPRSSKATKPAAKKTAKKAAAKTGKKTTRKASKKAAKKAAAKR